MGCKKSSNQDRNRTDTNKTVETTTTTTKNDDTNETNSVSKNKNLSKEVLPGSTFNRYFPKSKKDYKIVFSQEKKGFASANLKKKGKVIALLSITDTNNNLRAKKKYKSSSKKIKGYPSAKKGSKGLSILVNDRFQVSATSKSTKLKSKSLEKWITRFDLRGLSKL